MVVVGVESSWGVSGDPSGLRESREGLSLAARRPAGVRAGNSGVTLAPRSTQGEGDTLSGGDRIGMGTGAGSASSVLRRSTWGEVGELRSSWWCHL